MGPLFDQRRHGCRLVGACLSCGPGHRGQNPAQYAGNVADGVKQFSGAVDGIRAALQPTSAPQGEVDAELQKMLATDASFKGIVEKIRDLNSRKATLAQSIAKLSEDMTQSLQLVNANLLTLGELDRQSQGGIKALDAFDFQPGTR